MLLYIDFPSWIKPEIFGGLNLPSFLNFLSILRWYGLMYIVAISIAYIQSIYIVKHDSFKTINREKLEDFYFWGVLGLILGARILFCFVWGGRQKV